MDFSKFMEEDFDAKDWVNEAFKNELQGAKKDQHASTLVMKLQMYIQEVNNVLEENCEEALTSLTSVARQMGVVKQEATVLKDHMMEVRSDIEKVERETASSMHQVVYLDMVKKRMLETKSALQQADNWTTLSAEVDNAFESNNLQLIAEKLVGMQTSLDILTDVPDHKERTAKLESLKDRLEASLSTQIVSVFSSQNTGNAAHDLVKIFTNIRRLSELLKYYKRTHRTALLQKWKNLNQENNADNIHSILSSFYDDLHSLLHSQVMWCKQVFVEPHSIVLSLLKEVLQSLDPTLDKLILSYLEGTKSSTMEELKDFKELSERFHKGIANFMPSSVLDSDHMRDLSSEIYRPYVQFVRNYNQYLSKDFEIQLNRIVMDGDDIDDTSKVLSNSVSHFFQVAEVSLQLCSQFSNGAAIPGFINAFEQFTFQYCKEWQRVLVNVKEKFQLSKSGIDSLDNFTNSDDSFETFQICLEIAHASSEAYSKLDDLELSLVAALTYEPTTPVSPKRISQSGFTSTLFMFLCDDQQTRLVKALEVKMNSGDSMLSGAFDHIRKVVQSAHRLALNAGVRPLIEQLKKIGSMKVWSSETAGAALDPSLPDFSFSPQEYVTKIGQYLLTVPQQLDSVASQPSACTGLRYANLPFVGASAPDSAEAASDIWLEAIVKSTLSEFIDQILSIQSLSDSGAKQLLTDINYLCAVADDLGLSNSTNQLKNIGLLATANGEKFSEMVAQDLPQRICSGISRMRGLGR
ncbi:DgyrCDS7456 [Dimorphilus gyrociliatus]|uniref:Conserved oligomeric Golgi complex subunit 7 n=1 Tax=Dimorphilus gyrociliatus TaxID=2664684 RepID=A0A7I8VR76_9ANNE|nr:DgyrCDS7456 [Dimorphilus gyrociliatus]